MTRAEAWETLDDLEFLCRYIDAMESSIVYNTIAKSDRYKGIGQRLKTLKEQIINDNDADLARKIYSLVHEDKFEGGNICNAFYRLSVDLENEKELEIILKRLLRENGKTDCVDIDNYFALLHILEKWAQETSEKGGD